MQTSRHLVVAVGGGALLLLAWACSSEPRVNLRIRPPAPLGSTVAPVDSDGDGFFDASEPCPRAPEDGALPTPEDGCPAAGAVRERESSVRGGSDTGVAGAAAPSASASSSPPR